jgi:hypothetical protein
MTIEIHTPERSSGCCGKECASHSAPKRLRRRRVSKLRSRIDGRKPSSHTAAEHRYADLVFHRVPIPAAQEGPPYIF